jgi:hypothetical protein
MSRKNYLEILFFSLLCIPYALIIFGLFHNGQFFFFPIGLSVLLPFGAFIFYIEHKLVKSKINVDKVIIVLCIIDIVFGSLGWMLLLLVAVT